MQLFDHAKRLRFLEQPFGVDNRNALEAIEPEGSLAARLAEDAKRGHHNSKNLL